MLDGLDECDVPYHTQCMTGVDTQCLIASSTPTCLSKFNFKTAHSLDNFMCTSTQRAATQWAQHDTAVSSTNM